VKIRMAIIHFLGIKNILLRVSSEINGSAVFDGH
jgi:hypothetical protein